MNARPTFPALVLTVTSALTIAPLWETSGNLSRVGLCGRGYEVEREGSRCSQHHGTHRNDRLECSPRVRFEPKVARREWIRTHFHPYSSLAS